MSDEGVMFDYESAQRLIRSNKLVEGNPSSLFPDLPSGSMFDRPNQSTIPWEVLWVVGRMVGYKLTQTTSLFYTFLLNDFYSAFSLPYLNTRVRNFRIHSFKIKFQSENVTTDWIVVPESNNYDDIHEAIIAEFKKLSFYDEELFTYEYYSTTDFESLAQFSFGLTSSVVNVNTLNTEFLPSCLIEQVRYVEIDSNNQVIAAPTDAYFINPFYFSESNYILPITEIYSGEFSDLRVDIVSYENYFKTLPFYYDLNSPRGFALGFQLEDGRYLVPNLPSRIIYPLFSEGELDDLPTDS